MFSFGYVFMKKKYKMNVSIDIYYAFPTGSVYGFGMKRRQWRQHQWTPTISESASNLNIMHIVIKAGLFHILFGLIKFYFSSVLWF